MEKVADWVKGHKPHTAAIVVVVVAAICLAVAAASGVFATQKKTVDLTINVTADSGWDGSSTPAIAHVQGENVDFYHAVTANVEGNTGSSTVTVDEGTYTVSFISPINSDGSIYDVYGSDEAVTVAVGGSTEESAAVDCPMTQIPADQVTDEMLNDIIDQTKTAIENGDETLKGDSGQSVLDKLNTNVSANPNASDETKQTASDAVTEVDVNSEPANTAASTTTDSTTTSSNSSSSSSNGNGSSSSSSSSSSQTTHTHTWVDHTATKQVWVSNIVTVPDYTTQQVQVGTTYTFFYDGYTTTSQSDAKAHAKSLILAGVPDNYTTDPIYETQTVQTGSHTEDQGYYETQTYVDYQYCSGCGATK